MFWPRSGSSAEPGPADLAGHHRQVAEQLDDLGAVLVLGHAEAPEQAGVARPRRRCARPRSRSAAGTPVISLDRRPACSPRSARRPPRSPRCAPRRTPRRRSRRGGRTCARPRTTAALVPGPRRAVQHAVVGQLDAPRVDRDQLQPAQRRLLDARARRPGGPAVGLAPMQDRRVGAVDVGRRSRSRRTGRTPCAARRRSASGRRASSCRCCWCRSRRASAATSRSSPRWWRARRPARRSRRGRARPLMRAELGGDQRRAPPPRWPRGSRRRSRISGVRQPLAVARELVGEAALEAGVALVGGAVERRGDRGDRGRRGACASRRQPTPQ